MNYPKMLYKGNKVNYEHSTANDAEHEDELKDRGFVDYVNLPAYEPKSEFVGESVGGDGESVAEQNKALQEELKRAHKDVETFAEAYEGEKKESSLIKAELAEAKAEIDRLNQIIDAGAQENAELHAQLEVLSVSKVGSGSAAPNYSDMTSDELRALLDEKGIKYLARDSKDTLLKLLG